MALCLAVRRISMLPAPAAQVLASASWSFTRNQTMAKYRSSLGAVGHGSHFQVQSGRMSFASIRDVVTEENTALTKKEELTKRKEGLIKEMEKLTKLKEDLIKEKEELTKRWEVAEPGSMEKTAWMTQLTYVGQNLANTTAHRLILARERLANTTANNEKEVSFDECVKNLTKALTLLQFPILEELPFVERSQSFPSEDLRKFATVNIAARLNPNNDRERTVVIIHAASGAGKSAILDNIDAALGLAGKVLIVKASYAFGQDLKADVVNPKECLLLRFLVHLDHEDCLGKDIETEVLKKRRPEWDVTTKLVAMRALQKMKDEGKTRIAFVVDHAVALHIESQEPNDTSPVRWILSALRSLMSVVADIQQKKHNRATMIDDDAIANGFVSVLPTLSTASLWHQGGQIFGGLALTTDEAYELAKSVVAWHCKFPKDDNHRNLNMDTSPMLQNKIARQAAGYGGPHARSIVNYVMECESGGVPEGSELPDGFAIAREAFYYSPEAHGVSAFDVVNAVGNHFKSTLDKSEIEEEKLLYARGLVPRMKGSNRLSVPLGLVASLKGNNYPSASSALEEVARNLPLETTKAAEYLYAKLLLFQARADLPAFPPGISGTMIRQSDGEPIQVPLNFASLAFNLPLDKLKLSECAVGESFLAKIGEVSSNFNKETMETKMCFPDIVNHPSFEFSFPIKAKDPDGIEKVVVVLVQMTKSTKSAVDIAQLNQSAKSLQEKGLNVMTMLIARDDVSAKLEGNYLKVTGDMINKLFTPTFSGLYRALTESDATVSWLAGKKVKIERGLNTAGEPCLEMTKEVASDTETMLAFAGAIVVREPIERADLVVCAKFSEKGAIEGHVGLSHLRKQMLENPTLDSVPTQTKDDE